MMAPPRRPARSAPRSSAAIAAAGARDPAGGRAVGLGRARSGDAIAAEATPVAERDGVDHGRLPLGDLGPASSSCWAARSLEKLRAELPEGVPVQGFASRATGARIRAPVYA